jgi:hypothetical protein
VLLACAEASDTTGFFVELTDDGWSVPELSAVRKPQMQRDSLHHLNLETTNGDDFQSTASDVSARRARRCFRLFPEWPGYTSDA